MISYQKILRKIIFYIWISLTKRKRKKHIKKKPKFDKRFFLLFSLGYVWFPKKYEGKKIERKNKSKKKMKK